jgi:DNA-nicking Smr family endonuclease
MAKKDSPGFNTPFKGLARAPGRKPPDLKSARAPAPAAPERTKPPAPSQKAVDDARSFEQAMRGVKPLSEADRRRRAPLPGADATPPSAAPRSAPGRAPRRNDDADAEAELAELVTGPGHFTVDEAPGVLAGRAAGVDRRILRRLRAGDYPIEAELDLHGRTRDEAERAVEALVIRSRALGRRCVLVIHGRGINSGDAGPVLPEVVKDCLSRGPAARSVLAFSYAAPAQGGDGATLVLLRQKK